MFQLHVKLARDSFNTPWGFRLQGGKDLNQPLTIQRVFTNTPAEGELQRGDVIISINGRDAAHFTHKQAQDLIKFGGGQIELVVNRPPPGRDTVQPLAPQSPTKAPPVIDPFKTYTPVSVPIRRRSGPLSPPSRPNMPPPAHAGFRPKKVTLNKFGGGGFGYGTNYSPKTPPAQTVPAARPYQPPYQPPPPPQPQVQQQEQWEPAQPQLAPGEKFVEEEEYGPVRDRRKMFVEKEERPPQIDYDEDDYPIAPVWERKKLFSEPPRLALNRTHRPVRLSSQRSVPDSPYTSFGMNYTSSPQPYKPASPVRRPQPQPVNQAPYQPQYEVESTPAWGQTLKGQGLKPWEKEERERMDFEQKASMGYFSEPSAPVSPTPRIIQIKTQSTARPQQQQYHQPQHQRQQEAPRSVSPVVPPKPSRSPARSPQPYSTSLSPSAGQSNGPSVVHLQYNTPIGLYSKENIADTYRGQVQSRDTAASPATKPKPVAPQDRDWNQSAVYKMIHEEKTTTQQQMYPGQSPQTQTTTRTRETYETQKPGQEPKRTVKETFSTSGGPPKGGGQLTFVDESIGISDF